MHRTILSLIMKPPFYPASSSSSSTIYIPHTSSYLHASTSLVRQCLSNCSDPTISYRLMALCICGSVSLSFISPCVPASLPRGQSPAPRPLSIPCPVPARRTCKRFISQQAVVAAVPFSHIVPLSPLLLLLLPPLPSCCEREQKKEKNRRNAMHPRTCSVVLCRASSNEPRGGAYGPGQRSRF